jgi:iron complex outermembrane receptor protein
MPTMPFNKHVFALSILSLAIQHVMAQDAPVEESDLPTIQVHVTKNQK